MIPYKIILYNLLYLYSNLMLIKLLQVWIKYIYIPPQGVSWNRVQRKCKSWGIEMSAVKCSLPVLAWMRHPWRHSSSDYQLAEGIYKNPNLEVMGRCSEDFREKEMMWVSEKGHLLCHMYKERKSIPEGKEQLIRMGRIIEWAYLVSCDTGYFWKWNC